jgi:EF-P beta-lysylation protein EpmB
MEIVTPRTDSVPTTWRSELSRAIRDPLELCRRLALPASCQAAAVAAARAFPLLAPLPFVGRMRVGDVNDPLLRQLLPTGKELGTDARFSLDPLGEAAATISPGLLKKYVGRALILTTGVCAVHCRYCFRRHYSHNEGRMADRWDAAIDHIAQDETIEEVLLSGGDPLMLDDDLLSNLAVRIESIPHVQRLRIHTRLPIMVPARVDHLLTDWLATTRLTTVIVVHANHANELDNEVADAIHRLRLSGATLLNQAVLLRGVNDRVEAQESLCRRLVNMGVIPYYLHQLDRVAGAAHFEADRELGMELVAELRRRLPGYATPRFVQEFGGEEHKRVLI